MELTHGIVHWLSTYCTRNSNLYAFNAVFPVNAMCDIYAVESCYINVGPIRRRMLILAVSNSL